ILRADVATGAERHPNSRQRMMSYRGSGDLQTRTGEHWESNRLVSAQDFPLERRCVSVPENVWHQAVTAAAHWVVVSFHTVPAEDHIEEGPGSSVRATNSIPAFRTRDNLDARRGCWWRARPHHAGTPTIRPDVPAHA